LLICAVVAFAACNSSGNNDPASNPSPDGPTAISVRFPIPIVESGQATFYLAQDRGFYRDENLDVRFEMGSPELNPVRMVASGQDDFGVLGGPDTLLVARSRGQLLKAIAVLHRDSNFSCLLTLKSSGKTTLQQLNNAKVGFYYGHISTDVLRNVLRKEKVKYTEVDVGFDYNQLVAGQLDAQWAFTVTAGLDLPARGQEVNIISPADYGVVTHGYTIFAREETLAGRPDVALRFLRASLRGVEAAIADPEGANESLLKRAPKLDRELNLRRQRAYNAVTSNSQEFPRGYMDRRMFEETYHRLSEEKVIEKPFAPTDAYTTDFLERIHGRPIGR
jgi:ABC-type nitrate/sulfonate/bicarbonate transport system substrate-binding protein